MTPAPMKSTCHQTLCTKKEGFCEHMMFDAPCMCAEAYDEREETLNPGKQNGRFETCRTCEGSGTSPLLHWKCPACNGKGITNWKQDGDPR
jgi:DnaJ-class molecular chaperone